MFAYREALDPGKHIKMADRNSSPISHSRASTIENPYEPPPDLVSEE